METQSMALPSTKIPRPYSASVLRLSFLRLAVSLISTLPQFPLTSVISTVWLPANRLFFLQACRQSLRLAWLHLVAVFFRRISPRTYVRDVLPDCLAHGRAKAC